MCAALGRGRWTEPKLRRGSTAAEAYVSVPLRGFDVRAVPALLEGGDQEAVGRRALDALDRDLGAVVDQVPETALPFLKSVPIYLGVADPVTPCACYHVSPQWLKQNGYDPQKAKAVEIASALTYLGWRRSQPSMVLHELSHAYHDQVVGKDDGRVEAARVKVLARGAYDRVRRWSGALDHHYALSNADEYFAETTEALFGVNDFYPFVRAELMQVDPLGAQLVAELWGAKAPGGAGVLDPVPSITREIADLHAAFAAWFAPTPAAKEELFARFETAFARARAGHSGR